MIEPSATDRARAGAGGILAASAVLAILYLGRDVLVPIALAVILSLLISPVVRGLRRLGAGQTASVLVTVLVLTAACGSLAAVLGVQVARMAASLPQYEHTIRGKIRVLNEVTVHRLNAVQGQAGRLLGESAAPSAASATIAAAPAAQATPIPVEVHQPPDSALRVMQKVLGTVWTPLATAGIVLVVLVFLLLEQEAVRDRFIRIVGGTDLRATTFALNDAGERLSRFFVSQFTVNVGMGVLLWVGLVIIGVPHAMLWGALAAALRFVPYVGVWLAALLSTVMAAAVDPGWMMAIETLGLFLVVELFAAQVIEPQLYGHTTGLSPLSVVIAAIFWSWLWGPVGLVLSTPLTLCLVVAGRHIKALSVLDLLLGDTQALTLPQRFYQRALSSDSQEIIASAREFLKRNSFAAYCDLVLMPALHLAFLDLEHGAISEEQQIEVRGTIVAVIAAIGGEGGEQVRRRRHSVLEQMNAGRQLRLQREQAARRQPRPPPRDSLMLCVSLGSMSDDLATELLVRIFRDQKIEARHLSLEDLRQVPAEGFGAAAMAYLVSAHPCDQRRRADPAAALIRERYPGVPVTAVYLRGMLLQPAAAGDDARWADREATSFGEAVQIGFDWLHEHSKHDA